VESDKTIEGHSAVMPYIEIAKTFSRFIDQCIYISDQRNSKFLYISDNPLLFGGYSINLIKEKGFEFFINSAPKEEASILLKIRDAHFDFLENLLPDEKLGHSISYNFHLEQKNKQISVNHKMTPILLDRSGHVWMNMGFISITSDHNIGQVQIKNERTKESYFYDFEKSEWLLQDIVSLSDREREIIILSAQGLTNRAIAKKVHLCEASVKFHKTKIFRKLKVNNIAAAVSYVLGAYQIVVFLCEASILLIE